MCLAVPGRVVSIIGDESLIRFGTVDFGGVRKDVNLSFVPEADIGDYVLVHIGFALNTIEEHEANRVFQYLDEIGELRELEDGKPSGAVT
jgi:hydrogenase expression/formation protein HypC